MSFDIGEWQNKRLNEGSNKYAKYVDIVIDFLVDGNDAEGAAYVEKMRNYLEIELQRSDLQFENTTSEEGEYNLDIITSDEDGGPGEGMSIQVFVQDKDFIPFGDKVPTLMQVLVSKAQDQVGSIYKVKKVNRS